jgi:ribosome-associated toxin RatA of RatAB toxin-antitoxin module
MPGDRLTFLLIVAFAFTVEASLAQQADAATISFDAERRGNAIEIKASAVLKADAATAWRVLTDYGRYTDFIPDLRASHVVARRGATVIVEESGDATLGLLRVPLDVTFEITEFAPTGLRSRAVAGSLHSLESSYELTPLATGVRVDYRGRVEPGFEIPGAIEQLATQWNIASQFQALIAEIERRSTEATAAPTTAVAR